jgi:hypothetical protein
MTGIAGWTLAAPRRRDLDPGIAWTGVNCALDFARSRNHSVLGLPRASGSSARREGPAGLRLAFAASSFGTDRSRAESLRNSSVGWLV